MGKKRNWGVLFLIASLLITTTGCGYKDIDKRYFILNIGIDKGKGKAKYTIFIKIANPSEQGKIQSNDSEVLSIQSNSFSDGLELLKTRLDKNVDLGHMKVLMVSPYIAKHDMATLTDWIVQHRDIQRIAYVAIAKPSCRTILTVNPKTEKLPSGTLLLTFGDTGTTSP
ncbi:MAG TPA: Ger(x)C family spore germination protein, partial [Sporolactobacillaceae bacterium]|nr:Ger(x)C family spore germination protein [Sporolactobacillaceae bacterium]